MYVDKVYTTLKDNQNKIKLSNSSTSEDEFNEAYSIMLKIIKNIVDKSFDFDNYNFPNVEGEEAEILFEGKWIRGKIIDSYRFREGIVTIETPIGKKLWCPAVRTDLYRKVTENK